MENGAVTEFRRRLKARRSLPPHDERRALRVGAGASLRDIGDLLGVTAAAVQHWECGRREPSDEHLEAYAKILSLLRRDSEEAVT